MFRGAKQLALAMLFSFGGSSGLLAAEWQVVKVSGIVWVVGFDIEPMRATAGMVLPPDATIATTRNARAMLQHGQDVLNLGPGTQLAPQSRPVHGLTTVLMRQGDAILDIEHRDRPHFAVETPFLAAVVKGTRFTVDVGDKDAAVSVQRGRVRVTSFSAHESVDVTNGETARSSRGRLQFSGSAAQVSVSGAAARSAVVETAGDPTIDTTAVGRNDDNDATENADDSRGSASGENSSHGAGVTSGRSSSAAATSAGPKVKTHFSGRRGIGRGGFFSGRHVGNGHFKKNRRHRH